MNSTQIQSKRKPGRLPKYGFDKLKKPGDTLHILPELEGLEFFTAADAKRITTSIYSHRLNHKFGKTGRVLSSRSIYNDKGQITEICVVCMKSSPL